MRELIKINAKTCAKCQYHGMMGQKISCNYIACEGHSRIFEDGKMAFDPKLCDKFQEGQMLRPYRDLTIIGTIYEEFQDYKCVKVQKERSTYAYKHK